MTRGTRWKLSSWQNPSGQITQPACPKDGGRRASKEECSNPGVWGAASSSFPNVRWNVKDSYKGMRARTLRPKTPAGCAIDDYAGSADVGARTWACAETSAGTRACRRVGGATTAASSPFVSAAVAAARSMYTDVMAAAWSPAV